MAEIIKGQQINGSELSDSGKYYVMNGGIAPSGYYDSYNTEADTISISEGGNSCGYVQYNSSEFWSGGHCYTLPYKADLLHSDTFFVPLFEVERTRYNGTPNR
ncbi:restriction endonuclease subunit S [Phocaeicola vulgatus]|uniref:restriction endonuclease subunit S n=1 Tax=Phocaeicola vulgatus TaxID=821 RepID=UPI001E29D6F3|nr:restriction endonuclease subunit S [Phocaeicola vulgatus]